MQSLQRAAIRVSTSVGLKRPINLQRRSQHMSRILLASITIMASVAIMGPAQGAGDVAAGKGKAARCAGCHGANGQGVPPNPPLAGKPEAQQVQALKDYKSGTRPNPVMKALTASLSDQDMEDLSAYYASLK
jgi:cytochrome c553